jgi:hypothetical protein
MVFLVGARRSGTNWLQHLMTLHPEVAGLPSETHLFSHGISTLVERVQHGLASSTKTGSLYMPRAAFLDATRAWCDAAFAPALAATGARLLIERTPLHAQHLDLIVSIYPDAHVVHLVRDGTAVTRSLLAQEWGPTTADEAAAEWAMTVAAVAEARVPQLYEVRHEQLVADPAATMTALWEALGLSVDDGLREQVRREAPTAVNATAHMLGTRSAGALSESDARAIREVAGEQLQRLGYALPEGTADLPPAQRPRRITGAWKSVPRRRRAAAPAPVPGGTLWAETAQAAVDALLAALETYDDAAVRRALAPQAHVAIDAVEASGDRAAEMLLRFWGELPGRRQQWSQVHPAHPTFTVVVAHEEPGGRRSVRVLVVTPDATRIARVVGYGIPGN